MPISRMQQVRQNYGLGSFVKKAVRKVTKPFTKVAKKLVPKEIAGIMRTAAPFLPPGYREAAYLLGTAKQTGRISPTDLALAAAPTFFNKTTTGQNIKNYVGGLDVPFTNMSIKEALVGTDVGEFEGPTNLMRGSKDKFGNIVFTGYEQKIPATEGILGKGGKMFEIGKNDVGIFDTKAGQVLFGKEKKDGTFAPNISKLGSIGIGLTSLLQNAETPEEAGQALVTATGNSDDYERGYDLFSQLPSNAFNIPSQFRLNSAKGGLMRTNYAIGSDDMGVVNPFQPKPTGPTLPEEDKPFTPKPKPGKMAGVPKDLDLEKAIRDFIEFNGREPTDMQELIEFFNVPDKTQAADGGLMRTNYAFGDMAMNQAPSMGISPDLGSRPTEQESGLGGLPIEADMRYTGGFMPYGEVEKADDVPARLSKNEFVFTADAVRAAGGGSVQKGAKKMYDTMKQLEKQPEAKGAMA